MHELRGMLMLHSFVKESVRICTQPSRDVGCAWCDRSTEEGAMSHVTISLPLLNLDSSCWRGRSQWLAQFERTSLTSYLHCLHWREERPSHQSSPHHHYRPSFLHSKEETRMWSPWAKCTQQLISVIEQSLEQLWSRFRWLDLPLPQLMQVIGRDVSSWWHSVNCIQSCFLRIWDTFLGYKYTTSWLKNTVYHFCSTLRNNNYYKKYFSKENIHDSFVEKKCCSFNECNLSAL